MAEDAIVSVGGDVSGLTRALGQAGNQLRDFSNSVSSALGPLKNLLDVPMQFGRVNFAGQMAQVREFEASSARMAVAMNSDLGDVRKSLESTGIALGKRPQEVAAWVAQVGRLTGSYTNAEKALRGVTSLAALTGQTADDYRGLAVELANVGKSGGDSSKMIGQLVAQSEQLKNAGGIPAFIDQVQGLEGVISRFAVKSSADFAKVTALAGELGRGLNPEAAQRVQQTALGAIASDPIRWQRYLHRSIMDKHGQVADPTKVMADIVAKTKKQFGSNAEHVLQYNFGAETGAAMFNADYKRAGALGGVAPSAKPDAALRTLLGTDAGKRMTAEAKLMESSDKLLGSSTLLGRAADALQQFAAGHPVASSMATAGAGAAAGSLFSGATKAMTSKGGLVKAAAGAGGSAVITAAGIASLAAAGVGGYYLASEWDKEQDKRWEAQKGAASAEQGNKNNNAQLQAQRKRKIAQLEAAGVAHGQAVYMTDLPGAGAAYNAPRAGTASNALGGFSQEQVQKIVDAISQKQPITIVNQTGGPIEVAEQGRQSSAAGQQSGM